MLRYPLRTRRTANPPLLCCGSGWFILILLQVTPLKVLASIARTVSVRNFMHRRINIWARIALSSERYVKIWPSITLTACWNLQMALGRKWNWPDLLQWIPCVKPCWRCRQRDSILALRVPPLLYNAVHVATINANTTNKSLGCSTETASCFCTVIMAALWNRAGRYIFENLYSLD